MQTNHIKWTVQKDNFEAHFEMTLAIKKMDKWFISKKKKEAKPIKSPNE